MKKGYIIKIGNYPQDLFGNKFPIEWLVLDVKGNEALLISRYGLDYKQYHNVNAGITWEDCELRKWLNNDFIKSAFSEEEAKKIKVSELINYNNHRYNTKGGNDTKDRVFCLSITEANHYFSSDNDRQCKPTGYAIAQGARVYNNDCCCWWLRSPGNHQDYAAYENTYGIDLYGVHVDNHFNAVRPVLQIIFDEEFEREQEREQERIQLKELQARIQLKELQAQTYRDFLTIIKNGIMKRMVIPFGSYPQSENCCRAPIEWVVLDVKGNEALLISLYGLDSKRYKETCTPITWEDCDLRKWLNNDFIKSAFSEEEAKKIKVSELKNEDNHCTRGGNVTYDRVFCLSITEAEQYFSNNKNRKCRATVYARNKGAFVDDNGCCKWWLRSPGSSQHDAAYVSGGGLIDKSCWYININNLAVRPALRIILNEELELRQLKELQEHRERNEQERRQLQELQARTYRDFLAIIKNGIIKGMVIPFGSYPQSENCCRTPIEWLVLDVKGNEALLISRYGLYSNRYKETYTPTTWEDCDLKKWLNNDFIKSAFSEEEAKKIKVSELKNEHNRQYNTSGGNVTYDRVFCLSITEAEQYFSNDKNRQCRATAYARNKGAFVDDNGYCYWWLRSPGIDQYTATIVYIDGSLNLYEKDRDGIAVRPALWIILDDELEQERKQREEQEHRQREEQERRQRKQREEQERREREEQKRRQREEQERRQREEQERRQCEELKRKQLKELQAQIYKDFLAIIKKGIRKGMIIPFGSYPQNKNSCRFPIEWLVLDVKKPSLTNRLFHGDKIEALLISRYGLDHIRYHDDYTDITWEDCDLRKWLNNDFIKSAFSEEEVKKIKVSELKNEDNREYQTRGGNNTKDRIFCLSITEAEQFFKSGNDRQCKPTAYAEIRGAFVDNGCCDWWLRSSGSYQFNAASICKDGTLSLDVRVFLNGCAVRPALRIIF